MSGRFNQSSWCRASQDGIIDFVPPVVFDGSGSIAGSSTIVPVWLKDTDQFCFHWETVAASTLTGSLSIQVSGQRGNLEQVGKPDATLTAWTTIAYQDPTSTAPNTYIASTAVAAGATSLILVVPVCPYRWARLVFTRTAGTGAPRIAFQQKGFS